MFNTPWMPILRSLLRHRALALLIVVEVALAFAIVANALHLIVRLADDLRIETGQAEAELLTVELRAMQRVEDAQPLSNEDLRRIRALPGVRAASITSQVIYGGSSNSSGVHIAPNGAGQRLMATTYRGDEHLLQTMGLKLIAGRGFKPEEVMMRGPDASMPSIIINRSMAEALFKGQSALGKPLYVYGDKPSTVVGVVEQLTRTSPKQRRDAHAMLQPAAESYRSGQYLLRVDPAQHAAVAKAVEALIPQVDNRRWVHQVRSVSDMRSDYYAKDRAMVGLLAGVCAALLLVTAFGIVGLASFWVEQRTRMIGIRRALGATQAQITRYFQAENALLTGLGVLIGMAAAIALSQWMRRDDLPMLPWPYLPIGAALLLLLGQLAVLAPARRAARVPPALAMRA